MWCDLCGYGSEAFKPPPSGVCPQCRKKASRFKGKSPFPQSPQTMGRGTAPKRDRRGNRDKEPGEYDPAVR